MGAGANNHDTRNYGWFALIAVCVFLFPWVVAVHFVYTIPKGRLFVGLYYSALATPKNPILIASLVLGLVAAIWLYFFLVKYTKTNFGGAKYIQRLRGVAIINKMRFSQITKEIGKQLLFIGVPVPFNAERLHFGFFGSTGGGKTVAISALIKSVIDRKEDRMITIDPNGGYLENFFKEGDIILNPFDKRDAGWSIFNEIRTRYDVIQFSECMIPVSADESAESFNKMARVLVSETMLKIWENLTPESDPNAELLYYLLAAPNKDLFEFLEGSPALGLFGASETLGSIKAVLTEYILPYKYLKNGKFSIREFLENQKSNNLWIPWKENQLGALKGIISCQLDIAFLTILSTSPAKKGERLGFIINFDEVDSLPKPHHIISFLTKARKHLGTMILGIQALSQLDSKYGRDSALTLRNSIGSFAVCPLFPNDTYTPKQMSEAFGQHEVTRYQNNVSVGSGGSKGSRQLQKETELVVMPTEITGLKSLEFYFRIAQLAYVCKNRLPYPKYPKVTTGFIEAVNEWTEKKT